MAAKDMQKVSPLAKSMEGKSEDKKDKDISEDDSDENDVEPMLKYERLGNDLGAILSKDAASCMAVHPKFLALGTHWGMIHILDHSGNNIRSKELTAHTTTVNQISIDKNGDYIASCSDDGRVVINGLYSMDNNQTINFDRPIKAVAMDPNFFKSGSGKHFVSGDDKLVLNEKGFLSRYKMHVLHQGEGPIRNIAWKSNFIAWANDIGVKVYDMLSRRRITFIAKDNSSLRPELFRCNLCWKDERTLLIGWGNSIKVCVIRDREEEDGRDLPSRYVEIVSMFTMDFMVCGVAPHGDQLVILTYDEDAVQKQGLKTIAERPQLRVVQPGMQYYEDVCNDALSIRGFEGYRCNDYHLECLEEENRFFIVSPKDIVIARPRDQDDHIAWLIEHKEFTNLSGEVVHLSGEVLQEAMTLAAEHGKELKRHTYQDIGRLYMEDLFEEQDYDGAAQLCVKILGRQKDMWEEQAWKFAEIHQLKALAPYMPRGDPTLSPELYEMVLNDFLQTDHPGFKGLVKEWPSDIYHIQTIVNAVVDRLGADPNNVTLLECLGELYTYDKRYDKALYIYLKLKNEDVFQLIHRHNLFSSISDKIILLMEFEKDKAVKMLLDNLDKVPVAAVVKQLEHRSALLHLYLDSLFYKDAEAGKDYHHLQVSLYAEFDRVKLLPFLRTSTHYALQGALEECQQRNLTAEMVFLLGRMGNTKQALQLIVNELRDVGQAIDFCKEQNDQDLWEDLIEYSINKPSFITGLLHNIGTHVDPILLIQRIREGMEIPGLRDSLVKILQDYNLQTSLREGCRKILVKDCFSLTEKLVKMQKKGISVEDTQVCQACHERILVPDLRFACNVMVFHCRHTFHEDCLPAHNLESCMICSSQRRGPGSVGSPRK